jgi:glycosyltransferase involved in cell wall biosynthesis
LDQSGHRVDLEQIGLVQQDYALALHLRENALESHVRFTGRLPHDETLRRMAMADLLVVIQPDTAVQVPGKLYEMLPFRKPIVALTGAGATADVIGEYRLGVVAEPKDPQAIASAILRAAEMRPNEEDKDGWDRALQAFDGRALTASLAEALNRVSYRCVRTRRR